MNFLQRNALVICSCVPFMAFLCGCHSSKSGTYGKVGYEQRHSTHSSGSGAAHRGLDYSKEEMDALGLELVNEARAWLGTPYRFGGQDRNGTDCSGLVLELYRTVCAMKLPRNTSEQKSYCTEVARNKAKVGDLMFFGSGGKTSHVGLYIGNGEMIHASSSRGVMVSNVDSGYWGDRFQSAGRVGGAYEAWASAGGKRKDVRNAAPQAPVRTITLEELAAASRPKADELARTEATPPKVVGGEPAPMQLDEAVASIDALDEIISQKVDSIFSTQFMD